MIDTETAVQQGSRGPRVGELVGVVIGYALAGGVLRSFQSELRGLTLWPALGIGLAFLWSGLAMSGPFVFLFERRPPRPPGEVASSNSLSRYANAEWAWMAIGVYMNILLLLIIAKSLAFAEAQIISLTFIVQAVVFFWWWATAPPKPKLPAVPQPRWTRTAAVWVFRSWPIVWVVMFMSLSS